MSNNEQIDPELQERLDSIGIEALDPNRSITPAEVLYLLDHWPFLQIVSTDIITPLPEPEFITSTSGWVIHNYGDALSSSPGQQLFGRGDYRIRGDEEDDDDDDGGDSGIVNPDKGSVFAQTFITAAEMVALVKKLGWAGMRIVDGHPRMMWAAWVNATAEGVALEGFTPEKQDYDRLERLLRSEVEDQLQTSQSRRLQR